MFIPAPFTAAKKKVKTIQIFLAEEWINKLVYSQNGILLSHKKEKGTDTCYNMEP